MAYIPTQKATAIGVNDRKSLLGRGNPGETDRNLGNYQSKENA